MDLGILRGMGTVTLLVTFVVFCIWVWLPARRSRFEEASRLPFADDDELAGAGRKAR